MMRELSFGARISDSFVKKLKWETAKAIDESPGVMPCLCTEERTFHQYCDGNEGQSKSKRIDITQQPEIPAVNRLVRPRRTSPRAMIIRERAWVLLFHRRRPSPDAIFEIDGIELHISKGAQAELKGAVVKAVNDRIVVMHDRA